MVGCRRGSVGLIVLGGGILFNNLEISWKRYDRKFGVFCDLLGKFIIIEKVFRKDGIV